MAHGVVTTSHPRSVPRRAALDDWVTPGTVVTAAALLAAQGVFATIAGVAALSLVDTSLLQAVATLAVGSAALLTALMLVAVKPWARIAAIALEAIGLFGWLMWEPITAARGLVGLAVAAPVVALLVTRSAEAVFAAAGRSRRRG